VNYESPPPRQPLQSLWEHPPIPFSVLLSKNPLPLRTHISFAPPNPHGQFCGFSALGFRRPLFPWFHGIPHSCVSSLRFSSSTAFPPKPTVYPPNRERALSFEPLARFTYHAPGRKRLFCPNCPCGWCSGELAKADDVDDQRGSRFLQSVEGMQKTLE